MVLRWRLRESAESLCYNYSYPRFWSPRYTTGPLASEYFEKTFYLIDWRFEVEYKKNMQVWCVHNLVADIFGVACDNIALYEHGEDSSQPLAFNDYIRTDVCYYFKLYDQRHKGRYRYSLQSLKAYWCSKH